MSYISEIMRIGLFLFIFFLPYLGTGQQLLSERDIRAARAVSTDEIGNVYIVYEDNSLVQYSEKGDSITNFRSIQNGRLKYIDTRDPLKLLLFYPDHSKIVVLDRMLSLKTEIDLRQLQIFQVGAVSMAMDGNIWVYDVNNVQLIKIDERSNIINRSEDLRSAIRSFPEPVSLEESERKVYLLDPGLGVYVFDQFATFLNLIELPNVVQLQVYGDRLIYTANGKLVNFNPVNGEERSIDLPQDTDFVQAKIDKDKLYFLYKNKLSTYNLAL